MAQTHAELEIVLRWRRQEDAFDVSLAYDDPYDPQDRRDYVDEPLTIDTTKLIDLVAEHEEYGKTIGAMLFSVPKVNVFYNKALTAAGVRGIPVHFRLLVDPRAPQRYHAIRWEAMRDPNDGFCIATRHNLLLSRYLSTPDWRAIKPPPWHHLTALVAIAGPSDLSEKQRVGMQGVALEDVDVGGELERARAALKGLNLTELAGPGEATLPRLLEGLSKGVDVCYLVCHGGMYGEDPRLYLENEQGEANVVSGSVLAERIAELERPPTVVVLCSCQSAGKGDEDMASDAGALSSLGPRLAAAGVAAVVAMQGNITMQTASMFLPAFFAELTKDGVVDRAMAVARSRISDRERDWWMPVLFTRLKRGRPWYEPEFGDDSDDKFRALINSIQAGKGNCTPVIGSGVAGEQILPSREELAESWVDEWLMPIAPQNRVNLAKVAQYLSVRTAPRQTQTEVGLYLGTALRRKFGSVLPDTTRHSDDVGELIKAVGERHRQSAANGDSDPDPYMILAALRLPIYVTTSWTSLLEDAIRAAGRTPIVRHFDWHRQRHEEDDLPEPTRENPLVYHLFGTTDEPSSLVVTEDHYFAWLTEWIRRSEKGIPSCVSTALTDRSLLFLGYHLDDWEFRVLLQSVKSFPGSVLLKENFHVGVQVSPENTIIEPEAAQDYLAKYLDRESISIYWGTCTRFLDDLDSRMRARHD
jgi:CHAT domain/SIR2-like domain